MGLSVLVVDDSSLVRSRLSDLCAAIPGVARVDDAAGPPAVRRLLVEAPPDVVVRARHRA